VNGAVLQGRENLGAAAQGHGCHQRAQIGIGIADLLGEALVASGQAAQRDLGGSSAAPWWFWPWVSTPPVTSAVMEFCRSLPSFFPFARIGRHAAVGPGGQASDGHLLRRLLRGHATRPFACMRHHPTHSR